MPPTTTRTSSSLLLAQQLHDARADVHVGARQDRQADDVGVLLQRGRHDLLRRLPQPGVDDLHAGVAQRPGDDLRAPVVPIEPRLGNDDPNPAAHPGPSAAPRAPLNASHEQPAVFSQRLLDYRDFLYSPQTCSQSVAHFPHRRIRPDRVQQPGHGVFPAGSPRLSAASRAGLDPGAVPLAPQPVERRPLLLLGRLVDVQRAPPARARWRRTR